MSLEQSLAGLKETEGGDIGVARGVDQGSAGGGLALVLAAGKIVECVRHAGSGNFSAQSR